MHNEVKLSHSFSTSEKMASIVSTSETSQRPEYVRPEFGGKRT